jgi:hypothetical protein
MQLLLLYQLKAHQLSQFEPGGLLHMPCADEDRQSITIHSTNCCGFGEIGINQKAAGSPFPILIHLHNKDVLL